MEIYHVIMIYNEERESKSTIRVGTWYFFEEEEEIRKSNKRQQKSCRAKKQEK